MIGYLSFPNGELLPQNPDSIQDAIGLLVIENLLAIEYPAPGIRNITPRIWTNNKGEHELITYDNGEGLYRMVPKDAKTGYHMPENNDNPGPFTSGGYEQSLNRERPLAVLTGPHKDRLHVFGVMMHVPGKLT